MIKYGIDTLPVLITVLQVTNRITFFLTLSHSIKANGYKNEQAGV